MRLLPNLRATLCATASIGSLAIAAPAWAQTADQQSGQQQTAKDGTPASANGGSTAGGSATTDAQQAVAAQPQTQASPPDAGAASGGDVIVTGSRIAHSAADTISPVQVINSKEIDARGFSTLGQALNELPAFGVPGSSPVGDGQSSFGPGQSFVDFLGLGSQRTLVLVNGRRFVGNNTSSIFGPTGSGGSQVDLNVIPTKLIDRVETVAAIGAPIYGSDAIAGTVNIILKHDYHGIDIDAQNGITDRGDAADHRVRALAGFNFGGGRGNITFAGEYNTSKGLLSTDRALTATDNRFDTADDPNSPYTLTIHKDERIPSISQYGIPLVTDFISTAPGAQSAAFVCGVGPGEGCDNYNAGVTNAAGQQLKFDASGNLVPINFGTVVGPDPTNIFFTGGNGYSLSTVENLLTDTERYSGNLLGSFQVNKDVRLFAEGWYSVSQGRNLVSQSAYNSRLFGIGGHRDGNLVISINNPFLSSAARATILNSLNNNVLSDGTSSFYLARVNEDLQSGVATGKVTVIRGVFGAEGTLHVLSGRDWKFEASANIGRSITTGQVPNLNEQNFLNALNSTRDASGNIVCAPGYTNSPIATVSSTCAPFNPFGQQNSQATQDYITTIATPRNINKENDYVASVSGGLFKLPGGDLSFALGGEHREESSRFEPGAFFQGATTDQYPGVDFDDNADPVDLFYGRSVPIQPVFGKYHTNEVFGELDGDLVSPDNHVPLISALSFQTAGRLVDNSIAGRDFTWTAGGRYAPFGGLSFRGAFTRAIRAPSITEAFNPSSSSFIFADDPCAKQNIGAGPAPATRAANCAAAGVPANFVALSASRSFPGITIGNADLQNEKSDSFTVGAVLQPGFLRNFLLTVDYVNIRLKDAISEFSPDQVLNACYDSASYPNNPFCADISRDATHQLNNVTTSYFNSAVERYKGLLVDLDYRVPTPFLGKDSRLGFNVNYQHLFSRTSQVSAGDAPIIEDGEIGESHDKGVLTVNYDNGGFDYQVQASYIGPAVYDPNTPANYYSIPGVSSVTFINMSATYNLNRRFTIHADVDNVFNQLPPYPSPIGGGTITYFRGILGRYIRIGAGVHF